MDTRYARIHKAVVHSTQDEARAAFLDGRRAVLVTADRQTRGRGRAGAPWLEAPCAVYSSLAVAPTWPTATWPRLSLATGLAVADAIDSQLGISIALKWPNDLLWGTVKVGGILIEAEDDFVVVGCGVNLWWPDAPDGLGALLDTDPGAHRAERLTLAWVESLMDVLDGPPDGWDVDRYRTRSAIIGRSITWEPSGSGVAVDVDVDGYLYVETDGMVRRIGAGEVNLVREATVPHDPPEAKGSA